MSTNTPVPLFKLKLTYNKRQEHARNFFVHIYDVPSDVEVRYYSGEEEISFTKSEGYVRAGFWLPGHKHYYCHCTRRNCPSFWCMPCP